MLTYKQWLFEAFTSADSKKATKIKVKYGTLIVPRTFDACRKYGMATKWCITYKNDDRYWNDYVGEQKLTPYFFIPDENWLREINKKYDLAGIDLSKVAIMIKDDGEWRHIWDAKDENISELVTYVLGDKTAKDVPLGDILKLGGVDVNNLPPMEIETSIEEFELTNKQYLDKVKEYIDGNYNKSTESELINKVLSGDFFSDLAIRLRKEYTPDSDIYTLFYNNKTEIFDYLNKSQELKDFDSKYDTKLSFDIATNFRGILRELLGRSNKITTTIKENLNNAKI